MRLVLVPALLAAALVSACAQGSETQETAAPTPAELCPTPGDARLCNDYAPGSYIGQDAAGNVVVQLIENTTGLTRWVQVGTGGRVVTQR